MSVDLHTSGTPVTLGFLTQVLDQLMAAIRQRDQRIAALEATMASAAARRTMAFEGAFDPGRQYGAGDCVQRSGALFVALAATSEQPGSSSHWRRVGEAR